MTAPSFPRQPACNTYRPHYIELAKKTAEQFPDIQFFAVSCDKYETLCEDFDVKDFPSLRLFNGEALGDGGSGNGRPVSHSGLTPDKLSRALGEVGPTPGDTQRRIADDKADAEEEETDAEAEKVRAGMVVCSCPSHCH